MEIFGVKESYIESPQVQCFSLGIETYNSWILIDFDWFMNKIKEFEYYT